jgi:hypothetical protein
VDLRFHLAANTHLSGLSRRVTVEGITPISGR